MFEVFMGKIFEEKIVGKISVLFLGEFFCEDFQ